MLTLTDQKEITWFAACDMADVPTNGGVCVQYGDTQIALFHFSRRGEWYATQNECPHRKQMALSRGMIGTQQDEPKVACPFHKKNFSLIDGQKLSSLLALDMTMVLQATALAYIKPNEIAALALYLASDESAFTTGAVHVIDGGWTI